MQSVREAAIMSPVDDIVEEKDVFTIHHKNDNFDSLRQWRKATLALNATRRFRYTLDLKKAEEARNGLSRRVKAGAHTRQVVKHFQDAGTGKLTGSETSCSFGVGPEKLQELVKDQDLGFLHQLGGVFGLAEALHANVDEGLSGENDDIVSRKSYFGENDYPRSKPKGFWVFVWEACQDTTLMILMLCAVISLVTGMTSKDEGVKAGWYDGTSISCAIVAVILVTAISDYKQSLEFQVLSDEKKKILVQALRAGRALKISIFDLVVGDIVLLNIGDQVPADGVLIKGHSLTIDESSLTGESEHVLKDPMHPFLLSGCKVADGHGVMLVTGVGLRTEWGQIMASISEDIGEETPLQVRLNGTATFIGKVGVIVAVLVFIILFVRYFTDEYNKRMKASDIASKIADIFSIAVVIVVIAVPEGLPLAVTLTLAYSMRKMMEDKALVRHLSACETMGCATYICSDKTGTLTMNEMTVVEAWVAGKVCKEKYTTSHAVFDKLVEGIALNSNGMVSLAKEGDFEVIGSPTEKALLKWGLDIGMNYKHIKSAASILKMEAFNSIRKTAGVAVMHTNGNVIIHWKGAAEVILDRCTHWLNNDGAVNQMDDEMACHLREVISQMGASSLRCIAFAYQELPRESVPESQEQLTTWSLPDQNLIIIAITGIKDPCRGEVKQAVSECKRAGVKVCMVTGDNLMTAISIARECGIYSEDGMAIEGSTFRNYNNDEMMAYLTRIQVLARSLPSDKLLLVKKLKEIGEVVAVTGDGTNDAPALHEADIGLAMGISGTEVAKESSDVIILDDNFLSVVKMVKWGRSVYSNIQKFIQFQLTVNVSALAINFIASTTDGSVPLQTVQMLWVNLIMDTLGALALATERPTDDLMHRPSIGLRDPLVTNIMWRNLLGQAAFQLTAMLILYYKGITLFSLERKKDKDRIRDTIVFNAFVFSQLFNEINARKLEDFNVFSGIIKNKIFIAVIFLSAVFQVIMVEVLNKFAKTTDLTWSQWLICIGIGSLSLPVGLLLKTIKVPKKPIIQIHRSRRRNARESEGQQQPTQPEECEAV